ncbi:tautomerase family protein [Sphingomonas sp. M1-B02]|uniref:tautomerase family protein n=1 Tax=Sphingomonas sp. M1-B02 TaxID=3114300 RepID=UPI002240492D|nr:tautomerase family protein [Sphingomonas sp. S6-11]UZK66313.1 tautomerase family protein [Sphingomonas sp. S6-11]
MAALAGIRLSQAKFRRNRPMPLYTIAVETGRLDLAGRQKLAEAITALHVEMSGVDPAWVHVIFQEYERGYGFSAGRPAAAVSLTLLIRTGRPPDYKRRMLSRLWELVQAATAAPTDQIVIGIQEVPASQAMEMGTIMPDVAGS